MSIQQHKRLGQRPSLLCYAVHIKLATATVVVATAAATVIVCVVTAAAEQEDKDDNPSATATTKAIITHNQDLLFVFHHILC